MYGHPCLRATTPTSTHAYAQQVEKFINKIARLINFVYEFLSMLCMGTHTYKQPHLRATTFMHSRLRDL
jgi:hypothetical protein